MALDMQALRTFLIAAPRPAKILVTGVNGEQQEVLPPPKGISGVHGVTWASIARSIETIDPAIIELFDADNKLIRAQRFDVKTNGAETEMPAILARDAESARVALFAQHIANAYRFSVETAFTKLVEMFERSEARQERVETRLERVEGAYRRTMQERIDEAFDEADEVAKQAAAQQADPGAAILQSFMGGAAQGAAQRSTPNGKTGQ
jgi:hypothetical protein